LSPAEATNARLLPLGLTLVRRRKRCDDDDGRVTRFLVVPLPSEHFFTRVSRYAGGENRLTAVLAAVLERVPSLAWTLARSWTDPRPEFAAFGEVCGRSAQKTFDGLETRQLVAVGTQVLTPLGDGWVDLELRFGHGQRAAADDVVLWVEVKHGVDPHEDQLAKYVRQVPRGGAVVLLAPRSSLPYEPELAPIEVPQRSWQAVGQLVRESSASDPIADFLLKELYKHMQEQHLTDPELPGVLRQEHLTALAYGEEADRALGFVCRWVSDYLERAWGRRAWRNETTGRVPVPQYGLGYWESWTLDEEGARRRLAGLGERPALWQVGWAQLGDRWMDWNATNDPTVPESLGRPLCFVSGLAVDDRTHLTPSDEDQERALLLETGVELEGRLVRFRRLTDVVERLAQVATPDEVLVGATLREQSASLGAWINTGFKALTLPLDQLTPAGTAGA
jgi:hypothetical protein